MYDRTLGKRITSKLGRGKAIILVGPRQSGKTTLIKHLLEGERYLFLNADDPTVRTLLAEPNTEQLKSIIGNNRIVFIDEAQRISSIGLTLKLITDQFPHVQLLVSGSSSFSLSHMLNEPLTGRKWEYELLPISWEEYESHHGVLVGEQQLENRLLYGMYPDVLNNPGEEREILKQLVNSYLYRDLLNFSDIRKPKVLEKIVQSLALQVGSEVRINELAQHVGIDKSTVRKYIDILEKGYVVFSLGGFSRNLRHEIKKNKKIYFYDNGIRNMILGNFTSLDLRTDKGSLWENFLISERIKQHMYKYTDAKIYFWRTTQQQEVDLVEVEEGKITGFEFKWKAKRSEKLPKTFVETYNADSAVIDRTTFRNFVIRS